MAMARANSLELRHAREFVESCVEKEDVAAQT